MTDSSLTVARLINCIKHASNLSFIFVDLWFIFIFPQTTWSISQMLQEWIRQEMLADNGISFKGTSHFSQASGESKFSKIHLQKNEDLKRNVNKYYFAFFQDIWTIDVECCSKCNIFPPKKIQALFYNCFSVTSVWKLFDFPAKRLRKNTGAQNTHAPFFFFCIISSRKVSRLLCIIL